MHQALLLAALMAGPTSPASAPQVAPSISSLSSATLDRSGRLIVLGSDFGDGSDGTLEIAGLEAIATTWTPTEIHGYVPESAPLGPVDVRVTTPQGVSNALTVNVTPRQQVGRARWRFQVDSNAGGSYLAIGADGRIYATDDRFLYALTSDGGLRWALEGAGSGHPIALDANGNVYTWGSLVTGTPGVVKVDPAGNLVWRFVPPAANDQVIAGPGIGPDGNVYVVHDTLSGGLGVFSLDPEGSLRWSDPGSPAVFEAGGAETTEIFFAPLSEDRLMFGNSGSLAGLPPLLYGFSLSGDQEWTYSSGCSSFPDVDAGGRLFVSNTGTCGVTALDVDGNVDWNTPPPQSIVSTVRPTVGPDGSIYGGDFAGKLWALEADGTTRWFVPAPFPVSKLAVSPDGASIVAGQTSVQVFDPLTGALAWEEALPVEGGFIQLTETAAGPAFSVDSSTTYLTSGFAGNGPGYSYVLAFELAPEGSVSYCTAGTSASGCLAQLATSGEASATAAEGFHLTADGVEGQKDGLFFFGSGGRQANSWGSGTSFQCVVPPVTRGGLLTGSGTSGACDGFFGQDLNALWTAKPIKNPGAGATVQAQLWYRDPQNTSNQTTSLSDAIEFDVAP